MSAAVQFAAEVTAYLNKQYALNMKLGVETLDQPDELAKINDKLAKDQEYSALVEKYKNAWYAKSMKDMRVTVAR